jgi:hypothetical protein
MPHIKCSWCSHSFDKTIYKTDEGERNPLVCPHCQRTLPASIKIKTGNVVGTKHIHKDYK